MSVCIPEPKHIRGVTTINRDTNTRHERWTLHIKLLGAFYIPERGLVYTLPDTEVIFDGDIENTAQGRHEHEQAMLARFAADWGDAYEVQDIEIDGLPVGEERFYWSREIKRREP